MSAVQEFDHNFAVHEDDLWRLYQENTTFVRHYETLRASATSIIVFSSLSLVGVIASNHVTRDDLPWSIFLIFVGLYGAVFSASHSKNACVYKRKADKLRSKLTKMHSAKAGEPALEEVLEAADGQPKKVKTKGRRCGINSNLFRVLWPLSISLVGAGITAYILIYR